MKGHTFVPFGPTGPSGPVAPISPCGNECNKIDAEKMNMSNINSSLTGFPENSFLFQDFILLLNRGKIKPSFLICWH